MVENIDPNRITIGGLEYKVGGGKHLIAFANLLTVCKASDATPALSSWQQAQNAVATQGAVAAAAAISWASKIASAETQKQKNELIAAAAAEAAAHAVTLKQLDDAAKLKRDEFVMLLMATSSAAE